MKFVSSKYPQLVVRDLGVIFIDGEADVSDKTTASALRRLPSDIGVRALGGRPIKSDENVPESDPRTRAQEAF